MIVLLLYGIAKTLLMKESAQGESYYGTFVDIGRVL
jgi:hypothetical protein